MPIVPPLASDVHNSSLRHCSCLSDLEISLPSTGSALREQHHKGCQVSRNSCSSEFDTLFSTLTLSDLGFFLHVLNVVPHELKFVCYSHDGQPSVLSVDFLHCKAQTKGLVGRYLFVQRIKPSSRSYLFHFTSQCHVSKMVFLADLTPVTYNSVRKVPA